MSFANGSQMNVTLFQCTGCQRTSGFKHVILKHLEKKCAGARVISNRCMITYSPQPTTPTLEPAPEPEIQSDPDPENEPELGPDPTREPSDSASSQYVYLVTCPEGKYCKIGRW